MNRQTRACILSALSAKAASGAVAEIPLLQWKLLPRLTLDAVRPDDFRVPSAASAANRYGYGVCRLLTHSSHMRRAGLCGHLRAPVAPASRPGAL